MFSFRPDKESHGGRCGERAVRGQSWEVILGTVDRDAKNVENEEKKTSKQTIRLY